MSAHLQADAFMCETHVLEEEDSIQWKFTWKYDTEKWQEILSLYSHMRPVSITSV